MIDQLVLEEEETKHDGEGEDDEDAEEAFEKILDEGRNVKSHAAPGSLSREYPKLPLSLWPSDASVHFIGYSQATSNIFESQFLQYAVKDVRDEPTSIRP
jgi:hypothetical protein